MFECIKAEKVLFSGSPILPALKGAVSVQQYVSLERKSIARSVGTVLSASYPAYLLLCNSNIVLFECEIFWHHHCQVLHLKLHQMV